MAQKFITNKPGETPLSERVRSLTKNSARLDFLVGYFFFSGFCEVCEDLLDKPLRILVGMDADVDARNRIMEYATTSDEDTDGKSKSKIRDAFFENEKNIICKSDVLDTADFEKSYHVFLRKLRNGTLEVRKTSEPNHAKMYLFHIPAEKSTSGLDEGKVIVGSSNFSIQGFRARNEVNVYLQDKSDFDDGTEIFNALWENAVPLVSAENKDEFITKVLERTWLEAKPSPYLMYVRVLHEYFKKSTDYIRTPKEITHDSTNQFFDVSYQVDAIRDGVAKIKRHSGVIVADVVGLGKSVIASAIAANLDRRTVIITPPHLKQQWEEYAADFGLCSHVYSSGKLDEAVAQNKDARDLVVIIDEAHRYRNENTEAYGFLHRLCAGNKVILLSATPFNNQPEDIFSLIKLFQIPANSTIQTVNDLGNQMAALVAEYKKLKAENREKKSDEKKFGEELAKLSQRIREIIDPVVIRRTRVDLENDDRYKPDLEAQGIRFSDVKPPQSQNYALGELTSLYKETLELLTDESKGFKGARYKPLIYLKNEKPILAKYAKHFEIDNFQTGQRNMAKFMQQLLVRRFESSKYSFMKTLENVLGSMQNMLEWFEKAKKIPLYKKGKLPDFEQVEALGDEAEGTLFGQDDLLQSAYSKDIENGLVFVDAADITEDFRRDLLADITLFSDFISKWAQVKSDPKLNFIEESIKSSLKKEPERKIIVFTEFSATADYLADGLEKAGIRVMMYSSKTAGKTRREKIRANFDAGYPEDMQKNEVGVLVATDAISEGFSLHRAGAIYNYDIPYNPTLVIQRVGRINRVNKKMFDELFIYNFFPTATGEEISHTAEISTFKMRLFQAILGADTKILTEDETIDGYLKKEFSEAESDADAPSWDTEFRNELTRIEQEEKDILRAAIELPQRCRIARKNVRHMAEHNAHSKELFDGIQEKGVMLFSKKGDAYRFCFAAADGSTAMIGPQEALTMFRAAKSEVALPVSDGFYAMYKRAKEESGVVKKQGQIGETANNAIEMIRAIKTAAKSEREREYISAVQSIIEWDSVPEYYIRRIARMRVSSDMIEEIRTILPESYVDTIIEKQGRIGNEPETVLLAEEML
ncbi:MAG: hypothetical protein J1E59_09385 [Treponema sp.]|nr:hypothetical protein [Treponema sp.]